MYTEKSTNHMSSTSLQSLLNCTGLKEDTSNFSDSNMPADAHTKLTQNSSEFIEKAQQSSSTVPKSSDASEQLTTSLNIQKT